jgi:hypothetical protein
MVWVILFAGVSVYGATGTRHVFYIDSNGHVHQLYSTANGWSDVDLTNLTGAPPAKSGSGLTSVLDSATNYVHLYYQSNFIGGDEYELYGTGTTWHSNDVTSLAGSGAVPGPGDGPSSIIGSGSVIHVFYMQSGVQNLVELYWLGGTSWHADSPSFLAGQSSPPCDNQPSALTSFMDRSNGNNFMHIFCMGTFGDVYEFYYTGGSAWHYDVPTTLARGPAGSIYSNITSFIDNSNNSSIMHVFYLGTNLNVYELYYTGSWHSDDPTSLAGAPVAGTVSGQLSPLTSFINTSGIGDTSMHVMYLGTNEHVYALHYLGGTSWGYFDATASAGAPAAASGSALTSFQDLAGGVRTYFLGANSHVYELYWQTEGHASETDLTVASGGALAASGSALSGVVGP